MVRDMPTLPELIHEGRPIERHRPWPRAVVDPEVWSFAVGELVKGRWTLLGLWGEQGCVHMALLDEPAADIAVITVHCIDRAYPSVGQRHAPAIRLERAIHDLFGLDARGAVDSRPWLDHGRWETRHPLSDTAQVASQCSAYSFLPVEGESLHQIPVGPVHAGIIEPGHFRFTANGETVVRLEERLGYVHKGIENLMRGANVTCASKLAGRTSGDSTAAFQLAFARAVEAACDVDIPSRAHWLRALMVEFERLANHLGDIGAVCNDAAFGLMHAHCGVLREQLLRASDHAFGHRLLRDQIVPGGIARDLDDDGISALRRTLDEVRRRFPPLVGLYDNTASLLDRTVGTGVLAPELARRFGAGGFIGRASGRDFDTRKHCAFPPYDRLSFETSVREDGDVNARIWTRIREVEQSLSLVEQVLDGLPATPVQTDLTPGAGEGVALVEGFRGDVLVWLRLDARGRIDRCHLRDPSWFQWPLLEAAIEGNIVADFPLCNKSFNCSYSGHDL